MKKNKNKIIGLVIAVLTAAILLLECYLNYENTGELDTNKIGHAVNTIVDEINKSTTEIPELTEMDEQTIEVQETENEAFEEQGEIAYNGSDKAPDVSVGEYAGLTYYSQIDSRWKNKMYSSINNFSQTIGSSGCGPTSAAMVVSSIKGTITPDIMADLYVNYGYRSSNSGTYWSAFRWTADVFDIEYTECYKLDDVISKLKDNNYIIASCGNGLFTYGGHFVVLTGIEGDYIKVYDPYLYNGKFETSTRRGKAEVKGNTVYVSIDNFRNYANYRVFFCFKNDRIDVKENTTDVSVAPTTSSVTNVNYQVKIRVNTSLRIRSGASTSYSQVGRYYNGNIVTIYAESNGWGKTNKGWICLTYTTKVTTYENKVGSIKKTRDCNLYSKSNLSGKKYTYKENTTVIILKHVNSNVDKIKVKATGRIAYINVNNYK